MYRYFVFVYDWTYPYGGMRDNALRTNELSEVEGYISKWKKEICKDCRKIHVYDAKLDKVVYFGEYVTYEYDLDIDLDYEILESGSWVGEEIREEDWFSFAL